MPAKRFKIEKVPLDYQPPDHYPSFPAYPVLYLELIENKQKVIPGLEHKAQEPIFLPQEVPSIHSHQPMDGSKEFFNERDIRSRLHERLKKPDHQKKPPVEQDRQSVRDRAIEKQREEDRARELSRAREREREASRARAAEKSRQEERNRQASQPSPPRYQSSSQSQPSVVIPIPHATPAASSSSTEEKAILSVLGPSTNDPFRPPSSSQPIPSSVMPTLGATATVGAAAAISANLPPTLSEINQQATGPNQIKNLNYSNEAEIAKRKRDLLFRFDILKKSYKDAQLPEFTEFTDIKTLEDTYEDTVRKVGLDSKVEGYKKFLTMGFFGIEFLFTNLLKVDMSGFAKQQLATMNSYERILIELGEKAMLEKSKSQWPAEIRLLFTILMNAVIFLLMKNVMGGGMTSMLGSIAGSAQNTGSSGDGMSMMSGLMNMMSGLGGGNNAPGATMPPPPKPKPKMKGPSVNVDD